MAKNEPAETEISNGDYLRDLAERLRHIPVMYGVDDGDIFRLRELAKMFDNPPAMEG